MINTYFRDRELKGICKDDYVYKYIPLKYLKAMLESKKLRINKVSTWEDPYENFFSKSNFYAFSPFYKQYISVDTQNLIDRTYGQSWTFLEESDAMWRIYSNVKDLDLIAIRLKIKVDDLFDIVYTHDNCMATTSIGRVNYKTDKEINQWLDNIKDNTDIISDFHKYVKDCLLIKRKPFSHEEEVRIIICNGTSGTAEDFLEFDIKDLSVFEEFVIDPRLEQNCVGLITQRIEKLGIDRSKIRKSKLYDFQPTKLTI
jgi:hypothetical protein